MNRNYLIAGLGIGLVLGLSVTAGVAWFFKQRQEARRAAIEAAVADANAKEQAVKFTANIQVAPSPDELEGTWQVVSLHNRQGEATNKMPPGLTFRFESGKLAISHSKAAAKPGSRFHITPFATPKEIDLTETRSDGREETVLGIYRLDKGRLFIALDRKNPARRPKGYITGPNSGIEVMALERVP